MACKVGCFTRLWRDVELEDALKRAAKAGFRYVGVLGSKGVPTPESPASEVRELKRMIEDNGLKFVTSWAHMPGTGDAEPFKRHLDIIAELGGVGQLMAGPWPYKKFPDELLPEDELAEKYRVFFDEVAQVMDYAAERNLELMLKPHTGLSATGKECVASAEKVNHPNFRIWYDPGNVSFYEGVRPEGDIVQVAKYMSGMCVKDHKGARAEANFPTPGDGDVDWVRIFSTLKDSGFDGPCIVETVGAKTAEEADVQAVRVREFLMRTLQEVGLEAE